MLDKTELILNWQFCDGSAFQNGITQLNVPNGWGLRYVDHAPIPVADPPIHGMRPECLPASIWDVGGEGGKFGQSPPNPSRYNAVFKVHKGMAPFAFELAQVIGPLEIGQRYVVKAWFFADFYDAEGKAPAYEAYTAACGIGINGAVEYHWPQQYDAWLEIEQEFVAETERVEIALCGFSKWGLPGNTWWIHGARLYQIEDDGAVTPPPTPGGTSGVVELGPESRAFVHAEVERIIAALKNFKPGVPTPPENEPALWDADLRAELPRNTRCPGLLAQGWWQRALAQIDGITLHHTLSDDVRATARTYITKDGGRPSIPYHFWIGRDGKISYCLDLTEGCWHDHTGHENTHVSVGLAGVLDETPPTDAQLQAAIRLTRGLLAQLGLGVAQVYGHRDFTATRCPGWLTPPQYLPWRAEFYAGIGAAVSPPLPAAAPIFGLHDEVGDGGATGAQWLAAQHKGGLIVRPVYLGTHSQRLDFSAAEAAGLRVIVNLRLSYARDNGGQGTLPLPGTPAWSLFVEAAAQTIITSVGVWGWEIGNEANNPREFPVGGILTPQVVAETYNAIRARVWESTERPRMAPGALDPFNAQAGDVKDWLAQIWERISGAEFVTAHGYVRGPDPALVGSTARFADAPLQWQFLNYPGCVTELLKSLPVRWATLPVYITEFNHIWRDGGEGDWGWVNDARAAEIVRRAYQAAQTAGFAGVALYRWAGDQWALQHNAPGLGALAEVLGG